MTSTPSPTRLGRVWTGLAAAYLLSQALLPIRYLFYPGPVNWTEQGFRFAWRVMLIEKTGQVEYRVTAAAPNRRFQVLPREELTPLQVKMLATQPDMIQDYARHLARRFEARGYRGVAVRADAWVAFNGRPSQRLIDPDVDLASAPRSLAPKPWILPLKNATNRCPVRPRNIPETFMSMSGIIPMLLGPRRGVPSRASLQKERP